MLVEGKERKEEKVGTRSGPKAICMGERGEKKEKPSDAQARQI